MIRRRSIFPKDFSGKKVPLSVVQDILAVTNWAPTHGHIQPWRFVVVSQSKLQELLVIQRKYAEAKAIEKRESPEEIASAIEKLQSKAKKLEKVSVAIYMYEETS